MNGLHSAFTGRVGTDPEQRYTSAGKPMLKFSIVVDENSHATLERPNAAEPTWVRVAAWEELADQLAETLRKGALVYIEGRLKLDHWTAADGSPRYGLSCSAWLVQPMGQLGRQRFEKPLRPDNRRPVTAS